VAGRRVGQERDGLNPDDLGRADATEIVLRQGASAAAAQCSSGKRSPRAWRPCATSRVGIDQRSACRHPDWTGPGDLAIPARALVAVGAARSPH